MAIDSKRSLIGFTGGRRYLRPGFRGRFLDLKTLAFALTGEGYSLERACGTFGVPHGKMKAARHGRVTARYIAYNRRDVLATQELLERLRVEFDLHPIDLDPCRAYSPASLAKGYLRGLGVRPPRQQFDDLPPSVHGAAMGSYFGGRAECRIRRTPVPVVLTDFLSMYPTINRLMDNWRFLTARRLETVDVTGEVRRMLASVTLDDLFDPRRWPTLRFFALVEPEDDVLPVRAQYAESQAGFNIGINRVTAERPLWFAGPDLVASTILTGRAPKVVKAFRLKAVGRQAALRSVQLRGSVPVDPCHQDFFRAVIEARQRAKDSTPSAPDQEAPLPAFLKRLANAGSYGIFAEQNRRTLPKEASDTITVHGTHGPFRTETATPEEPGEFCFPPLAALITAGARLMLALLERCVTDAGGSYAFCDTDSMAIVATESGGLVPCEGGTYHMPNGRAAVRALSWAQVEAIRQRFVTLNPYDQSVVRGSILKIEKVNLKGGMQREIFAYVISAKRYALFIDYGHGNPRILKVSQHGLGHLLHPDRDLAYLDADPKTEEQESNTPKWMQQFWHVIVCHALGRAAEEPSWLDRPAISRWTITTPTHLASFKRVTTRAGQRGPHIRPANFVLTPHVAKLGCPTGADPTRFHLMGPYELDARRWLRMDWVDVYSGTPYRISTSRADQFTARVASYRDVLTAYEHHPEPKSAAADGAPSSQQTVGLLARRHVHVIGVVYIGKESNSLEAVEAGLVHDAAQVMSVFDSGTRISDEDLIQALKSVTRKEAALLLGVTERTVARLRNGHQRASPRQRTMILSGLFDSHRGEAEAK